MKFICGDLNAKVGLADMVMAEIGRYCLGQRNVSSEKLIEFCKATGLCTMNTMYKQLPRRLYT